MKKITAIICAVVMSLSTVSVAFANPSISEVTIEQQEAKVDEETTKMITEGKKLIVTDAMPENYESKEVAEVVTKLNDPKEMITMKEILEILKVDTTKEIKTESGTVINPEEYEPISEFADLVITDGVSIEYDINGQVKAVTVTITVEALKEVEDINNILLMQLDPKEMKEDTELTEETEDSEAKKNSGVYFIEIEEENYVAETGEITVTFPCLGPFAVIEKPAEE